MRGKDRHTANDQLEGAAAAVAEHAKSAEEYRQTADEHVKTLKDFWKDFLVSGIFILAAIVIIFACLAWFATNSKVSATGSSISAKGVKYAISSEGTQKGAYDQGAAVYDPKLDISDSMYVSLDSNLSNMPGYEQELHPGSYGSITFYVQWLDNGDPQDVCVDIARAVSMKGSSEDLAYTKNLLKGHILFFKSRTNDFYSNWLGTDGVYDVTAEALKNAPNHKVECRLYWVWPERFENFVLTGKLNYNRNLFAGVDDDYNALYRDVRDNRSRYFRGDLPDVPQDHGDMGTAQLQACSAAYDAADEYLGNTINYMQLRLSARLKDEAPAGDNKGGN